MAELKAAAAEVPKTGRNILLAGGQLPGHLVPLVSIGQMLVERGHNVYLITAKVSEHMPGRLISGTGIQFIQAGDAPEDEAQVAKYLSEKLGPKVNVFVKMVRGRTHLMTLDGMILKNLVDKKILTDELVSFTGTDGKLVSVRPDLIIGDHYSSMLTSEFIAEKYSIPLIYNSPTVLWDQKPPHPYPIHTWPRGLAEMTLVDRVTSAVFRSVDGYYWIKYMAFRFVCGRVGRGPYNLHMSPDPGVLRVRLTNTAVPFDYPVSHPPLLVYTGPLIYPPPESDPDGRKVLEGWPALRDWLEQWPKDSVVVVSMGSHARLGMQQGTAVLQGLTALDAPVLWALREDNREFVPPDFDKVTQGRIRLEKWIPQKSVMAHPNTGAFMGHCGMGGLHEALYFGVPMVGMPVFIDQPELGARLRECGAGLTLNIEALTPQVVSEALFKLTGKTAAGGDAPATQSSYTVAAKKVSKYLRLQGGVTKCAEVCEMAMEAGGTDMYILPQDKMPRWKRNGWDVKAFLLVCTVGVAAAVVTVDVLVTPHRHGTPEIRDPDTWPTSPWNPLNLLKSKK